MYRQTSQLYGEPSTLDNGECDVDAALSMLDPSTCERDCLTSFLYSLTCSRYKRE